MKQLVIMNKVTGEVDLAVRINFFDQHHDLPIMEMPNYKIHLVDSSKCDGWLTRSFFKSGKHRKEECWIFVNADTVNEICEILCEL